MTGDLPLLEIRGLSLPAGDRLLLEDISLRIGHGEMVAVIGPNGAGKTTLLRTAAGLVPGGETAVRWNGRPLGEFSRRELARLLAYVPQLGERLPPCSVFDFVLLARYAHGDRWFGGADRQDREAAGQALEAARVTDLSNRDVSTLSGGERQKVLIAAALAQEAPALLLDEPASFLDYQQELGVRELLARLHRESGKTVITVVHDLNRGVLEADRVIALQRGRVIFDGTPAALAEPDRLRAIFGAEFDVFRHERTGRTIVLATGPGGPT